MTTYPTELDEKTIVDAIKNAEKKTSAEFFAVFTERSDDYRFIGYAFLAFWIFIASLLLALWINWHGSQLVNGDWGTNTQVKLASTYLSLSLWTSCQLLAFVAGVITLRLSPRLCVMLAPRRITHERAHSNAVKQFLAHGIHQTKGRTGVLIFISMDERFAEILVDSAIEKQIGREFFLGKIRELTADCHKGDISYGYVKAINSISKRLSADFPPGKEIVNELEDRLVVL
ncbi:MAG: hypothetical protein WBC71_12815 [Salaquimonas sp.]